MASLFILAMVQNPRVLKKAQAEIDSVVGAKRLPLFRDRASLPYVDAIMSETFRWGCPVPLSRFYMLLYFSSSDEVFFVIGIPHRLMEDDVYEGKLIPKGSLVSQGISPFGSPS